MKATKEKDTKKRDEGAKGKASIGKAVAKIQALRGVDISKMAAKEKEDLLIVVCQLHSILPIDKSTKVHII